MRLTISLRLTLALALLWVVPCHAQLTTLNAGGTKAPAVAAFSLTYESSINSTAHTATVDYGTMTYGSGCTRVIVAISTFASTPTISSISVNGVGGSAVVTGGAGQNVPAAIWETSSSVSGSSGDVQVTYSTAPLDNSVVALYCLVTTTPTVASTGNNFTSNGTSISANVTPPTGGGGLAFGIEYSNGSPTFTNATSDATVGSSSIFGNVGHTTSTGSAISVTLNVSGASTLMSLALAAWGP